MNKKLILFCLCMILYCTLQSQTPTIGLIQHDTGSADHGYVLFPPTGSTNTYLINKCGKLIHSWSSTYTPGISAYFLPDGCLLRTGTVLNSIFPSGGQGGIIEKIDWNNNVTWSALVSDANHCQHHDIAPMPNGNVLVIAWDKKTKAEAIQAGRRPNQTASIIFSEKVLELKPVGNDSAFIVWEWNLWDHLIQEYDSTKLNFGVVADHPELININFKANSQFAELIHFNSIDYNADLDQIVLSGHRFDEIYIIDHSTTILEAASHTGGNSGKGGDILYRWGNPKAYQQGDESDRKLFKQHDTRWIKKGFPYEEKIMIFNNGTGRPNGNYSSVDIIAPPMDSTGNYIQSYPFGPNILSWTYFDTASFYGKNISGAEQLDNGNVLICEGPVGKLFEIDNMKNKVWEYINPVSASGPMVQGSVPNNNAVFKIEFIPVGFPGLNNYNLTPGNPIEINPLNYTCILANTQGTEEYFPEKTISCYPSPANEIIYIETDFEEYSIFLYSMQGQQLFTGMNIKEIQLTNFSNGIYLLITKARNAKNIFTKIVIAR
ncbi:aryl-sulfate sulfotransferase [candidate division KSB1 bacterium]